MSMRFADQPDDGAVADDAYVDSLRHYTVQDALDDELAGHPVDDLTYLILALKEDVDRPLPSPWEAAGRAPVADAGSVDTGVSPAPAPSPVAEPITGELATVSPLPTERTVGKHRRGNHQAPAAPRRPLVWGLVGAAAATVVIAGVGVGVVATGLVTPPPNQSSVVGLASTLEELERSTAGGDQEATRELLEKARQLLAEIGSTDGARRGESVERPREATATTLTVTAPATTVTQTVTQTPEASGSLGHADAEPAEAPSSPVPAAEPRPDPGAVSSLTPTPSPAPAAPGSEPTSTASTETSEQTQPGRILGPLVGLVNGN